MKTLLIILLCSFMYADSTTVVNLIHAMKLKHAPDKRTTIFTINFTIVNDQLLLKGESNLPDAVNELNAELKAMKFEVENLIELLPEKELGNKIYGVIALSVANHRTEPKHSAEMATQSLMGTFVKVWKKRGEWYLVQTPDNYLGWVDDDGLALMEKDKADKWLASERVIITVPFGLMRLQPDLSSNVVTDLVAGDILELLSSSKEYYHIMTPDGREGYIPSNEADLFEKWVSERNPDEQDILASASVFMGYPYLWGGTSTKGVDCSGFTKSVYFLNGLITPRDASQQVHSGIIVDTKSGFQSLEPGDLLFFGFKKTDSTQERVTHVGIYIGNDEFIHASGRVKINSLNKEKSNFSQFRFNTFIRAKRYLNEPEKNGIPLIKNHPAYFLKEVIAQ